MYTVALFAVFGILFGVVTTAKYPHIPTQIQCWLVRGGKFALAFAAVGAVCAFFLGFLVPQVEVVSDPTRLVAMRTTDGANGAFLIGRMDGSARLIYTFMQKVDDDTLVPESMEADSDVHFKEDPTLKDEGFWTTTFLDDVEDSALLPWAFGHSETILRQDIRVPVGTIVQQGSN